jgi:hypothetical protein
MTKNFFYRAVCIDGKGWDAMPDGLWGRDYSDPADRIFGTSKEAWDLARATRGAGCWQVEDDNGDVTEKKPVIGVEKCAVYEACWMDADDQRDEIDRIIDIHGGPILVSKMPRHVAEFLVAKFGGARQAWMRESANLVGASSATHTAAFIGALYASRVAEIDKLFAPKTAGAGQ